MKKSIKFLPLLSMGLVVVGCQDYDAGFTESDIKAKQYADNFTKEFGQVDPNQDWSMAQNVSVDIRVPQMISGEVTVYTSSPLGSNCKILGNTSIADGVAHLNIDVVKGTKEVYVIAKNQDGMAINGYFDIKDNALNIVKGAVTRAAGSPATIGDEMNVKIYMLPTVADMNDPIKGEWYSSQAASGDMIVGSWSGNQTVQTIQNLYMLDGVDLTTRTDEMMLGDLASFLRSYTNTEGKVRDGVFKEGTNHVPLMGTEIEADAFYTMAADGPVSLDFVYKGTVERHNYLGYFYYPENEEMTADKFRTLNKYVVCPFITGNANCQLVTVEDKTKFYLYTLDGEEVKRTYSYRDSQYNPETDGEPQTDGTETVWVNGTAENGWQGHNEEMPKQVTREEVTGSHQEWQDKATDGSLLQWAAPQYAWDATVGARVPTGEYDAWTDIPGMSMPSTIANSGNDIYKLRGTKIPLTFFGYDGTATPSLTFPEGCKIGFFFLKYQEHGIDGGNENFNKLYTSFATLNRDLINTCPTGATFRYRDYVVLGLEDQPDGDKDQNDVLFLAQGNFKKTDIPDLTPEDDPEKEPETQKWLVACEDLGGTFDYDFNDIIIGFEKKTDGHLWMTPLTSGGTLPSVVSYEGTGEVGEIHQLLGDPEADIYAANVTCRPGTAIDLGECDDEGIAAALEKLFIKVDNGNDEVTILKTAFAEEADETPQMLLLPGGWDWPSEGTRITYVYDGFVQWVKDADYTSWTKKTGAQYITNTWGK